MIDIISNHVCKNDWMKEIGDEKTDIKKEFTKRKKLKETG